jgi:hypothetical protein
MGIPAPAGIGASGLPPVGDKANAVVSGTITAVGPTAPFAFYGPFNLDIWASINTTLTTTLASASFSVASGTGLAVGNAINGVNIPAGTTIGTFSSPNGTFAFAPGQSTSGVFAGADATATFTGAAINFSGTVQLERSFNGGATWIVASIAQSGTLAQWTAGTPVSTAFSESEKQVLYRLNCIAYTSGTINYRLSQTGVSALSVSANTPI